MKGFVVTASYFPGINIEKLTRPSLGNLLEFNQSDEDFYTPEVFCNFVCRMHQTFIQMYVGVRSETETNSSALSFCLGAKYPPPSPAPHFVHSQDLVF